MTRAMAQLRANGLDQIGSGEKLSGSGPAGGGGNNATKEHGVLYTGRERSQTGRAGIRIHS